MRIQELTEELDKVVNSFLNEEVADNDAILAAVFELNNEIGMSLQKTRDPVLRELQLRVNELTKAAKSNDKEMLAKAIESVRAGAAKLP